MRAFSSGANLLKEKVAIEQPEMVVCCLTYKSTIASITSPSLLDCKLKSMLCS